MIRRPPRSTLDRSSAASDVYKRQVVERPLGDALLLDELPDRLQLLDAHAQLVADGVDRLGDCLLYTSPSPRDRTRSRMPSSA